MGEKTEENVGASAAREFTPVTLHKTSMTVNFSCAISQARKELILRPPAFIST